MFKKNHQLLTVPVKVAQAIDATFPTPSVTLPACFFFSMPKCGSTMLTSVLNQVLPAENIPCFHFARLFWQQGESKTKWSHFDLRNKVIDGVVYYGFRSLPKFIAASGLLKTRKSIFLLRDPRDAATSHYFSKLYEHPVPGGGIGEAAEKFLRERSAMADANIDTHVVEYAQSYMRNWRTHIKNLPVDRGRSKIYRYEDIIYHKLDFFRDAFQFLDLQVRAETLEKAVAAVDIFPKRERVHSRVRSVKPGNHREKLKPETIERLNKLFAEPLKRHGYL